jgi:hypothetical protein
LSRTVSGSYGQAWLQSALPPAKRRVIRDLQGGNPTAEAKTQKNLELPSGANGKQRARPTCIARPSQSTAAGDRDARWAEQPTGPKRPRQTKAPCLRAVSNFNCNPSTL